MVQQYIMLLTEVFYANKEQFVEQFLQDDQLFFKKIIITNLKKMGRFWDTFYVTNRLNSENFEPK